MLIYRCLITLLTPVLLVALFLRVLRRQESWNDFGERLGIWRDLPRGDVIWIHGASNGELSAARPVIEALAVQHPNAKLLITCNSISAKKMVKAWGMEPVHSRLAPLDLRWIYARLLNKLEPQKFILIEADFWPNRMNAAQAMGIPIALIGGRISDKSARMWARFPNLSRTTFQTFDLICAQDERSATRLIELGVSEHAFGPQISLKSLFQANLNAPDNKARQSIWLAASTHDGEDEILLRAHLDVLKSDPAHRMILAPRHPKRAPQIAKLANALGLNVTQRSLGDDIETPSHVYIADTLGEMALWYETASTCFVGGSLVPKGGHTPYEPLAFGCALMHGPHLENFTEPYAKLAASKGALMCLNANDIARNILALTDQEKATQMRQNARNALQPNDGLDVVLAALSQMSKN